MDDSQTSKQALGQPGQGREGMRGGSLLVSIGHDSGRSTTLSPEQNVSRHEF